MNSCTKRPVLFSSYAPFSLRSLAPRCEVPNPSALSKETWANYHKAHPTAGLPRYTLPAHQATCQTSTPSSYGSGTNTSVPIVPEDYQCLTPYYEDGKR